MPVQVGVPKQEKLAEKLSPVPEVGPPKVPVTACANAAGEARKRVAAKAAARAWNLECAMTSPRKRLVMRHIVHRRFAGCNGLGCRLRGAAKAENSAGSSYSADWKRRSKSAAETGLGLVRWQVSFTATSTSF